MQDAHGEISTEQKLRLVQELFAAGVAQVEATSFVSPKWIPKLADAEALMKELTDKSDTIGLVPNFKGYQRAEAAGVSAVTFVVSASPRHQQDNLRMSLERSLDELQRIGEAARNSGIEVRGAISCSFGSPYEEEIITPHQVASIAKQLATLGASEISLADTVGVGTPEVVSAVLDHVRRELPNTSLALHLHDRYGLALGNIVIALERGVTTFETALGGLGGCPFAPDAPGNLNTETFVGWMQRMGIETGVDLTALAAIRSWLLDQLEVSQS
ncbi:hydroxymethylglutaryl-CoA lyase [Alicyclobacillus dauci]|uniref:Hydroxymethylglutaryl-CoA lyase n=1 Tax=Alicyclobacillus dauci TaxID=1475485 RepID=A0ABY6Z1P3_9BACL|nr:hydroxymethylglutaryl-CoA lyase [Alicyclobacillus dauci]WAH36807.1 hydroxymethylglutaryl-CoA lyase [Alicyclobacillus dauci]